MHFARRSQYGWIGADFGARVVKVAQLVRSDGEVRLAGCAAIPLELPQAVGAAEAGSGPTWSAAPRGDAPATAWRGGEQLGDAARAARELAEGLRGKAAAAAVSMRDCEVHLADLATADESPRRLGEATRSLLADVARTPLEALVFDAWPAGDAGAARSSKRYVLTLLRASSDAAAEAVRECGWRCRAIDAQPWAAARALALSSEADPDRGDALLDWGASGAVLTWAARGVPLHARPLKRAALARIFAELETRLGLFPEESRQLLANPDLPSATQGGLRLAAEIVRHGLAEVAEEIRRTLVYWRTLSRGGSPQGIVLAGGGALLPGAVDALATSLALPVRAWDLPRCEAGEQGPATSLFAVAAGLSALAWEDRCSAL
jgi:Tfp pilus assembly PilM family ATPase